MSLVKFEKFINDGENYFDNFPFPHCISDGIWDKNFLENVEKEIKSFKEWDGEKDFYGAIGKRYCGSKEKLPIHVRKIIDISSLPAFIKCLEKITGEEGLIPDPYLEGGGIHSTINKGFLKMHTDFNWHKELKLFRRLNLLIYVNSGWQENWLGDLKLGLMKKNKMNIYSKISPKFNRTVLFTTTDSSFHGHPEELNAPEGIARNSIALYYYVSANPNRTSFTKRETTTYFFYDTNIVLRAFRKIKSFMRNFKRKGTSLIKKKNTKYFYDTRKKVRRIVLRAFRKIKSILKRSLNFIKN